MLMRVLMIGLAVTVLPIGGVSASMSHARTQTVAQSRQRGGSTAQQMRMQAMQQQMRLRMGQMQATAKARAQAAKHHQQYRMDGLRRAQQIRDQKAAEAARSVHSGTKESGTKASAKSGNSATPTGTEVKLANARVANPSTKTGSSGKKP